MNPLFRILLALELALTMTSCSQDEETTTSSTPTSSSEITAPSLEMDLPDTLTGGASSSKVLGGVWAKGGPNCSFEGGSQSNPFENGHAMTKFLTGIAQSQLCLADYLSNVAIEMDIAVDGELHAVPGNDSGSPSHIQVTANSDTQTTVQLYWNNDKTNPSLFLSWNVSGSVTSGRMVLDAAAMGNSDSGAPDSVRVDFTQTDSAATANVYMAFPDTNSFLTGFRVQLIEDKTLASTAVNRIVVKGRMDMKDQFGAASDSTMSTYITEIPNLKVYTLSDGDGKGAAVAIMSDMGLSLGTLGYYIHTKRDEYFFASDGTSEWVEKTVTDATYKGGKTADTATDSYVDSALGITSGTTNACGLGTASSCVTLMQGIYTAGWSGQEQNSGADPGDDRTSLVDAITSDDMLSSVYPSGESSWDNVFDMSFTP